VESCKSNTKSLIASAISPFPPPELLLPLLIAPQKVGSTPLLLGTPTKDRSVATWRDIRMTKFVYSLRIWLTITFLINQIYAKPAVDDKSSKYYQTPMHEILQNDLYVGITQYGEYAVTYTGKGADVKVLNIFFSNLPPISIPNPVRYRRMTS
jgi:hypothetical protein